MSLRSDDLLDQSENSCSVQKACKMAVHNAVPVVIDKTKKEENKWKQTRTSQEAEAVISHY